MQYKPRMNPLKCDFDISFGKLSGFILHMKELNLDWAKTQAIQAMEPHITCKQLKSFIERMSYAGRFISSLSKLLKPFYNLLKKNAQFH